MGSSFSVGPSVRHPNSADDRRKKINHSSIIHSAMAALHNHMCCIYQNNYGLEDWKFSIVEDSEVADQSGSSSHSKDREALSDKACLMSSLAPIIPRSGIRPNELLASVKPIQKRLEFDLL